MTPITGPGAFLGRHRRLVVTSPTLFVVSLWIREGRVAGFEAYERKTFRIMKRYDGVVERMVRVSEPGTASDQPIRSARSLLSKPGDV